MRDNDEDGLLLGRWNLHGATREALAAAVGQDWETLRKRLVRRGLMAGRSEREMSIARVEILVYPGD